MEREVVFSSNAEVVFEHTPAALGEYLNDAVFGPRFMGDSSSDHFRHLIQRYSARHLGHQEDALNAIFGMLNTLTKPGTMHSHIWIIPFKRSEANHRCLSVLWWLYK